jgi:hypothetical protein
LFGNNDVGPGGYLTVRAAGGNSVFYSFVLAKI